MAITQVAPISLFGVSAVNLTPITASYRTTGTVPVSAPQAYSVDISRTSEVRSLKLEGLTAADIAMKTGLDVNTVNQYLGSPETAPNVISAPTYSAPKKAYSEPTSIAEGRKQLTEDLNQLTFIPYSWSNLIARQSQIGSKPTTPETNLTLFTIKPAFDEFSLFRTSSALESYQQNRSKEHSA